MIRTAAVLLATVYVLAASAFGSEAPGGKCCVWRVTNVPVPFYLMGTIHALSAKDYPLPPPYQQALRDSKRLLFEINPSLKSDFSKKFAAAAKFPKGQDVRAHLHPQTQAFLIKNFRISNYNWNEVQKYRAWAIANLWGIRGYTDVSHGHGADNHLAYEAQRLHKETAGLETDNEHIAVLQRMSDTESEIILLDAIIRGDKRRDDYNELRAAWKRGDTSVITAQEDRFRKQNLGASLRLLDYRNLRWIRRIEAEMKTGKPTSIVAGTAHFCGPNSVIDLLQKRGYKIEQL